MANTPNMNLELPTVGADENVWDDKINAALEVVDVHDHTPGKGVKVPVAGIDFNDNIDLENNKLKNVDTVRMTDNLAVKTAADDVRNVYVVNGDLYYNNAAGVPVQITVGSAVSSAPTPLVPSGVIMDFAGGTVPAGFLACDGSAVSRTTYADLYATIGIIYGNGDGLTTFNLPDLRGRTAVGAGTYTDPVSGSVTRTIAQSLGAEKHLLQGNESGVNSHSHSWTGFTNVAGAHSHYMFRAEVSNNDYTPGLTQNEQPATGRSLFNDLDYAITKGTTGAATGLSHIAGNHLHTFSGNSNIASPSPATDAHNNMQPSLVVTKMIKY